MKRPHEQEGAERGTPSNRADPKSRLGLCADCRWRRDQPNRRGQTFHRCARADEDDRFSRYPPLPVLRCPGHETDGPR